jgi:predicted RNase H-like nuclease (RuvC/YqgF family)
MVRKRIGDLLREEAKEPVEGNGAAATAENDTQAKEVQEELPPVNIPAKSRRSTTTTTEPETTIDDLKKLLQTAQKTESSLQAQITDLKSQLQDQKKLIKDLQTQASQEKQLKTELEEAKKTILKLAEVSSKPPAKATPARKESNLAPSRATRTEKMPNYSDPSERPNTTLGNKDIGWFD